MVYPDLKNTILLSNWDKSMLWASWATRLDDTHLFYVTPDEYSMLVRSTDFRPPHFRWKCGDQTLVILGNADPDNILKCGVWTNTLPDNNLIVKWALQVDRMREKFDKEWSKAFEEAREYHVLHRDLVRKIATVLHLDMDSHNLSKTTLVLHAVAFKWFWPYVKDKVTTDLSDQVIEQFHLKCEDHYSEFLGHVDVKKLVVDRLATHILIDTKDKEGGWNITSYIVPQMKNTYDQIKEVHGHLNLYELKHWAPCELPKMRYYERK